MSLLRKLVYDFQIGVVAPVVIFALAGRWDLWNVWVYGAMVVVLFFFQTLVLYRKSPDLLKERMKPPTLRPGLMSANTRALLILAMLILHWSIAGLDQRFHWSDVVPPVGVVAGLVIVAIGLGLFTWAMLVNPFFSSELRIQSERGQRAIAEGPYSIVRHPGYVGLTLVFVRSGVALNSLFSIIPMVVIWVPGAISATKIEDRMLHDELAGYADYAAKVRYRLIPGIW
jgi:protein-S-isoprenylcysteine O-methyltransferase Ste14